MSEDFEDGDWGGPYVAAAFVCETVLEGKDGTWSFIRVIDRVTASGGQDAPEVMPTFPFRGNVVLLFRSGRARGRHTVMLRPETPNGLKKPEIQIPLQLEGEGRSNQVVLKLDMDFEFEGLYWFDVLIDRRMVSRIPFRVIYQPMRVGSG